TACPPVVEERERLRCVEVLVEHSSELPAPDLPRFSLPADEEVTEGLGLRARLSDHFVVEVDRLSPLCGHEVEQDGLPTPLIDRVAKRDDVAERLRHLLASQLEHPVVHPHPGEIVAGAS